MDTVNKIANFMSKSTSLRSTSREGIIAIWSDDVLHYDDIAVTMATIGEKCERVHTFDELCKLIKDGNPVKSLVLDCPTTTNVDCTCTISECIEYVDAIRKLDKSLPLIFYTPNPACVIRIKVSHPRLTPVLKGDLEKLRDVLGG